MTAANVWWWRMSKAIVGGTPKLAEERVSFTEHQQQICGPDDGANCVKRGGCHHIEHAKPTEQQNRSNNREASETHIRWLLLWANTSSKFSDWHVITTTIYTKRASHHSNRGHNGRAHGEARGWIFLKCWQQNLHPIHHEHFTPHKSNRYCLP